MDALSQLEGDILQLIERLDEAAEEAFTHSLLTMEQYEIVVDGITTLQRLMLTILEAIDQPQQNNSRQQDS